jgi:hypothetical protein
MLKEDRVAEQEVALVADRVGVRDAGGQLQRAAAGGAW